MTQIYDLYKFKADLSQLVERAGPRTGPPDMLESVILGARMEDAHQEQVLSWIANRHFKPQVLKATLHDAAYKLRFERLPVNS